MPRSPAPAPSVEIPDKLYFKIGEVADLVGVQTHVLRYWEKEIPAIRPAKSTSNQRRYRRRDVEIFREIRKLLYQERYTLAGARKRLSPGRGGSGSGSSGGGGGSGSGPGGGGGGSGGGGGDADGGSGTGSGSGGTVN